MRHAYGTSIFFRPPRPSSGPAVEAAVLEIDRSLAALLSVASRTGRFGAGSTPGGIALHAASIGGRLAPPPFLGCRTEAALRPIRAHFHPVASPLELLDGRLRQAALHHQNAGASSAWPKRQGKVFDVPGGSVNRLLQVHLRHGAAGADVAQEHLAAPLVLLIAARRTPAHVRLAVSKRHAHRQGRARALAGRERSRQSLFEPEHLPARAERPAEIRDHRGRLQPAPRRCRREHIARPIDDIDMHGITDDLALRVHPYVGALIRPVACMELGEGGLTRAGCDRTRLFDDYAAGKSLDVPGPLLQGGIVADQLAPFGVVAW